MIRCRGLRKVYRSRRGTVAALDGVDLDVEQGEFLAVVGASGSGKSTLLMALGGLVRPTAGEVHVNGTRVDGLSPAELGAFRASTVGFVFQLFHLVPYLSATDNVLLAGFSGLRERHSRARADAARERSDGRDRAEDLLRALDLGHRLSQAAGELSAGEQQRVAIARALFNDPPLILADEPTGNLDPERGLMVLEHLGRIHEQGRTVLLVTHSPEVARSADRRIELTEGRLAQEADGPADLPASHS